MLQTVCRRPGCGALALMGLFLLLAPCRLAPALDTDVPIHLSDAYCGFAVKWVTPETAGNKIALKAEAYAPKAQVKLQKALASLAKKPSPARIEKFKVVVEKLLSKAKGATSAMVWVSLVETLSLTPQTGMTGTVTVGDGSSGGLSVDYTLSQKYTATIDGHPLTAYYSALPTTYGQPFAFNALVVSDELIAASPPQLGAVLGLWVCAIVDTRLPAALASAGVANETTAAIGESVSVQIALTINGSPKHKGSAGFSATYFSIQDLFGVGVPPQATTVARETFEKLLAKVLAAKGL